MRNAILILLSINSLSVFSQGKNFHSGVEIKGNFFSSDKANPLVEKRFSPSITGYFEQSIIPQLSIFSGVGALTKCYKYNIIYNWDLLTSATSTAYFLHVPLGVSVYPLKKRKLAITGSWNHDLFIGYNFFQKLDFQGNNLNPPIKQSAWIWENVGNKTTNTNLFHQVYQPRWEVGMKYRLPLETHKLGIYINASYSNNYQRNASGLHFGIQIEQ